MPAILYNIFVPAEHAHATHVRSCALLLLYVRKHSAMRAPPKVILNTIEKYSELEEREGEIGGSITNGIVVL